MVMEEDAVEEGEKKEAEEGEHEGEDHIEEDVEDEEQEDVKPSASGLSSKQPSAPREFSLTPWGEATSKRDPKRIVGWSNGRPRPFQEVQSLLQKDPTARRMARVLRKGEHRRSEVEVEDPYAGMPANFQAFWRSVPHLDPKRAVRQLQKKRRQEQQLAAASKRPKTEVLPASLPDEAELENMAKGERLEDVQAAVAKMEGEIARLRSSTEVAAKGSEELETKLRKVRTLDKEEELVYKKLNKEFYSVSYERGQAQGKVRSSDQYFTFIYQDTETAHKLQMSNLQRSMNLLKVEMGSIKEEIRSLMHDIKKGSSGSGSSRGGAPSSPHSHSGSGLGASAREEAASAHEHSGSDVEHPAMATSSSAGQSLQDQARQGQDAASSSKLDSSGTSARHSAVAESAAAGDAD